MDSRPWLSLDGADVDEEEFTLLWLVAAATYGVGDIVTTVTIIWFSDQVVEANLLVRVLTDTFGQGGLVGLKLVAFVVSIFLSVYAANQGDRLLYYFPPCLLSIVGTFTTAVNLQLLLG